MRLRTEPTDTFTARRIVAAGHEDRGNGQSHFGQSIVEIEAAHLAEVYVEHQDRAVKLSGL